MPPPPAQILVVFVKMDLPASKGDLVTVERLALTKDFEVGEVFVGHHLGQEGLVSFRTLRRRSDFVIRDVWTFEGLDITNSRVLIIFRFD